MNDESAPHRHPSPDDARLAEAVALLDAGDAEGLRAWLMSHADCVNARLGGHDIYEQGYFKSPTLLHLLAGNPICEGGVLPGNLVELATALLDAGAEVDAGCGESGDGTALGLVVSGRLMRESGQQAALIDLLCNRGADPSCVMIAALGHGELDAARALLRHGAPMTLSVAAALGDNDTVNKMFNDASALEKRRAIALSSHNGQKRATEILADRGVDPNLFNPEGTHVHTTPLHNAVAQGHVQTVVALVTRGADMRIKDQLWGADAFGWATYCKQAEVSAVLKQLKIFMPGVEAVRSGDVPALSVWLEERAGMVNETLPGNGRTLLHYVTDWPGNRANADAVIAALVAAGADPDARFGGEEHSETPLHWAASCDDIQAVDALVEAGADLNPLGAVITGGTPLHDAVIFQQRKAAARLLEHGAAYDLWLAAGSGRLDLVEPMFDAQGDLRDDAPRIAGLHPDDTKQHRINWAFFIAAEAADVPTLEFLYPKISEVVQLPGDRQTVVDRAKERGNVEVEAWLRQQGLKGYDD